MTDLHIARVSRWLLAGDGSKRVVGLARHPGIRARLHALFLSTSR